MVLTRSQTRNLFWKNVFDSMREYNPTFNSYGLNTLSGYHTISRYNLRPRVAKKQLVSHGYNLRSSLKRTVVNHTYNLRPRF